MHTCSAIEWSQGQKLVLESEITYDLPSKTILSEMWTKMNIIHRKFLSSSLGNSLRVQGIHTAHQQCSRHVGRKLSLSPSSLSDPTSLHLIRSLEKNVLQNIRCQCYSQSAEKSKGEAVGQAKDDLVEKEGVESQGESAANDMSDDDATLYDTDEGGLPLSDEDIQYISKGDEEIIKRIKYIQLEHAVMKQEGEQVPVNIKLKNWEELIQLNSRSRRKKFYLYLFKTEMKELSSQRKKITKREARLKLYAENPLPSKEDDIYGTFYALTRNSLFLRLYDTTINKYYNGRACSAMVHNPPLVLDCSYDEFMTPREAKNCAKQIEYVIAENRTHKEPFNLHLCNAGRDTKMMRYLRRMVPILDNDEFIVNVHEECFTEVFPKNRLVYLSPHTRDELDEYDENDIYIIGAMVDKSSPRPYSLAKAKKLDVTMKRLPLDRHLMWGLGGKSLTVNQMVKIMLDVRFTRGNWKTALEHVPMRKLNRDLHPYPNQIEERRRQVEEGIVHEPRKEPWMSKRRERKSLVYEDSELLNRRKGFHFQGSSRYTPRPNNNISIESVRAPRMKSILNDD